MLIIRKSCWDRVLTFVLILFIFILSFTGMIHLLDVASAAPGTGSKIDLGHYYNDDDGFGYQLDASSDGYGSFISRTIQSGMQPLPDWTWTKAGAYEVTKIEIKDLTLLSTTNYWVYDPSTSDYYLYQSSVNLSRYSENVYGVSNTYALGFTLHGSSINGMPIIGRDNGVVEIYSTPGNPVNYVFNFYYGGSTVSRFHEISPTAAYELINIGDLYNFKDDHRYQVKVYYDKITNPEPYSYLHVIHNYDGIMVSGSAPGYDCENVNEDRISSGFYNFESRKNTTYMGYDYVYDSMKLHYETVDSTFTYYDINAGDSSEHTETFVVGDVFDASVYAAQANYNNSSAPLSGTISSAFAARGFSSLVEPDSSLGDWWNISVTKISKSSSLKFLFGAINPLIGGPITYFQNNTVSLANDGLNFNNYEYNFEEGLHYVLVINYKSGIPVTHHYMSGLGEEEIFTEGKIADPNIYTDLSDWKRDLGYNLTRIEVIESASWLNLFHYSDGAFPSFAVSDSYIVLEGSEITVRDFLIPDIAFWGYTVTDGDSNYLSNQNSSDVLSMNSGKNILNLFYNGIIIGSIKTITSVGNSYARTIWDDDSPFGGGLLGDNLTNAKYQFSGGKLYEVHYYYVKGNPTTYTLTYNLNGVDSGIVPVDSIDYPYGSYAIAQPNTNLVKSGYEFICWNDEPDGSGQSYYPGVGYDNSIYMNDDKIMYAVWSSPLNIPVTHNYIKNTVRPAERYYDNELKPVATNVSVILNDWYEPNHGIDSYSPLSIVINESQGGITTSTVFNNDVGVDPQFFRFENNKIYDITIYYAIYSYGDYNVIYHPNGADSGSVPVDSLNPYYYRLPVTVLDNLGSSGDGTDILEKAGETFTGWNTMANGYGISLLPGDAFIVESNNTVNLYAQWVGPVSPNVTFNAMGGTFHYSAAINITPTPIGATYDRSQTDSYSNELLIVSSVRFNSAISDPIITSLLGR
jgi:Listeria-Bacteroides repeat domain (List_Bact_rpt).